MDRKQYTLFTDIYWYGWYGNIKTTGRLFHAPRSYVCHFMAIRLLTLELSITWKRSNWSQIVDFSARMTLKFDGWPPQTIGQLFYATSSFEHYFVAICELKLGLQSGNTQFRSKLALFCPVWPSNLTNDFEKQQGTSFRPLQALCIIWEP